MSLKADLNAVRDGAPRKGARKSRSNPRQLELFALSSAAATVRRARRILASIDAEPARAKKAPAKKARAKKTSATHGPDGGRYFLASEKTRIEDWIRFSPKVKTPAIANWRHAGGGRYLVYVNGRPMRSLSELRKQFGA